MIHLIPKERRYDFCAQLNIASKKFKMFQDNLENILCKNFTEKLFSTSDLESAFKQLEIKMPLLHQNEEGSSFPGK